MLKMSLMPSSTNEPEHQNGDARTRSCRKLWASVFKETCFGYVGEIGLCVGGLPVAVGPIPFSRQTIGFFLSTQLNAGDRTESLREPVRH
jgi:hypothetical protein